MAQNILAKPQFNHAITYLSTPCGNHTIKHFRGANTTIQRLSTTTQTTTHNDYNVLTFNTSEISSIVHHLRAL